MVGDLVTCRKATMYEGMLTRGKSYNVLGIDEDKRCIKLVCDNGKTRLFHLDCFDLEGKPVEKLVDWKFDDNIEETKRDDFLSWVDVSFTLSDGSVRWCKLFTIELLDRILRQSNINPPGIYIPHIILVRSFEENDVDEMLKYLDNEDELISCSLPIDSNELDFENIDHEQI